MENETIDIDSMDAAQLKEYLGDDYQTELPDQVVPTDTPQASDIQQPSTEGEQTGGIRSMDQVYQDRMAAGRSPGRPGVKGFLQDTVEGTARNMYSSAAPIVGLSDTLIDAINFASAGDQFDIPKLPAYESKMHTAVRNISGLVIPSLGLRSMAIQGFSKLHAAGKAAPWLQRLGNTKSFSYFAKFGIDVGTGGMVDYIAEQNQKDQNLLGTLKEYWPKTYQWNRRIYACRYCGFYRSYRTSKFRG